MPGGFIVDEASKETGRLHPGAADTAQKIQIAVPGLLQQGVIQFDPAPAPEFRPGPFVRLHAGRGKGGLNDFLGIRAIQRRAD